MDFSAIVSDILRIVWEALTWFFNAEERLAIHMERYGLPYLHQVAILTTANVLLILSEFGLVHLAWTSSDWVKNLKTPGFLKKVAHQKPVTLVDLFLFAFIPIGTQKVGVVAFHAKREQFGFRGFAALAIGGMLRVSFYRCWSPGWILPGLQQTVRALPKLPCLQRALSLSCCPATAQ